MDINFEKWPSNSAREWVKQLVQIASGDANICAIVAFGSIVRDVEHSVDADILLVYEYEKSAFEPPPFDVDLKAYHKTEHKSPISRMFTHFDPVFGKGPT